MTHRLIMTTPRTKDGKNLGDIIIGTRLIEACIQKDFEKVKSYLEAGDDVNEGDYLTKNTPLHWASMMNNHQLAKVLLDAGAVVNSVNSLGMKPLHCAASYADGEMCKVLIENGAFENAVCNNKYNPLDFAIEKKNHSALKGLLDSGVNPNQLSIRDKPILFDAIKAYDFKAIDILLDAGADLSKKVNGYTPLHLMISKHGGEQESKQLIYKMIAKGADVNAQDPKGYTPLHYATAKGDSFIVTKLITNGASASIKDKEGKTPLNYTEDLHTRQLLIQAQKRDKLLEQKDDVFQQFAESLRWNVKPKQL